MKKYFFLMILSGFFVSTPGWAAPTIKPGLQPISYKSEVRLESTARPVEMSHVPRALTTKPIEPAKITPRVPSRALWPSAAGRVSFGKNFSWKSLGDSNPFKNVLSTVRAGLRDELPPVVPMITARTKKVRTALNNTLQMVEAAFQLHLFQEPAAPSKDPAPKADIFALP
jgi:hypothetical protein